MVSDTALRSPRFDATSLLPYTEETSYENSMLVRQTADLALSSLKHVFKSLTPNARGIFILLAKNQVGAAGRCKFSIGGGDLHLGTESRIWRIFGYSLLA